MTNKRYPTAIDDLLTEFDEMDYCPTNLCNDPEREAKIWKENLIYELDLILDEKTVIERRAIERFAAKIEDCVANYFYRTNFDGRTDNVIDFPELCEIIDRAAKEYENE